MWHSRSNPYTDGLFFTVIIGLAIGLIVNIGSHADIVKTSLVSCQDRVIALQVSNACPHGTFLEYTSDDSGGRYIICHCEQPLSIHVWSTNPEEEEIPSLPETPKPFEL